MHAWNYFCPQTSSNMYMASGITCRILKVICSGVGFGSGTKTSMGSKLCITPALKMWFFDCYSVLYSVIAYPPPPPSLLSHILPYKFPHILPSSPSVSSFPESLARHYFTQALLAVVYLHERGVFHRDIKPENCVLDGHFNLKLTDFGTNKVCSHWSSLGTRCACCLVECMQFLSLFHYLPCALAYP